MKNIKIKFGHKLPPIIENFEVKGLNISKNDNHVNENLRYIPPPPPPKDKK